MPVTQVDDDGFTMVTKKMERLAVKSTSKSRRGNRSRKKYEFKDPDDWTLDDLETILTQRREALFESRFYSELSSIMKDGLIPRQPQDIVCYGIGSMQHSKNAQYQFVLALDLREQLQIPGKMCIFDPVMTELDKTLCKAHQIDIIDVNEEGKRLATRPTLFYMPHCGRGLYSNTLSVNWSQEHLSHVTIFGNLFSSYVSNQLEKDLKRECPYLIPAMEIVEALLFPSDFDNGQIFNDLAIQYFSPNKMASVGKAFWAFIPPTSAPTDPDTVSGRSK